jgi:hypothetical protein
MPFSLFSLLRQQQAAQFADVAGAQASIELPIADRLVSEIVAERLESSSPLRGVRIVAAAGNRITVHFHLARPAFLPPFRIGLIIEQQPDLPASPIVVLKLVSGGIAALAGSLGKLFEFLPPGVALDGDRVTVDLATVLRQYGAAEALAYVRHLQLTTTEGRFIVTAGVAVPGPAVHVSSRS